jgi:hypothetical protein
VGKQYDNIKIEQEVASLRELFEVSGVKCRELNPAGPDLAYQLPHDRPARANLHLAALLSETRHWRLEYIVTHVFLWLS